MAPWISGLLLHLCAPATWRMALAASSVAPPSLLSEGFVHPVKLADRGWQVQELRLMVYRGSRMTERSTRVVAVTHEIVSRLWERSWATGVGAPRR